MLNAKSTCCVVLVAQGSHASTGSLSTETVNTVNSQHQTVMIYFTTDLVPHFQEGPRIADKHCQIEHRFPLTQNFID